MRWPFRTRKLFTLVAFVLLAAPADRGAQAPAKKPASQPRTSKSTSQAPPAAAKSDGRETAEDEQIPQAAPDALFPAVVARVNGKAILGRDLEQRIRTELAPIGNPKWTSLREDYRQELIDGSMGAMVGAELIYQKAAASGYKAAEAEVQAEFNRFAKSFGSDAEMNIALADRNLDRAALMRQLAKTVTVNKFIAEAIEKKVTVPPAEVSQYYQQHTEEFRHPDLIRTSHILIKVPGGATEEQDRMAKQRAVTILARVKKGEDFAKLAKENSMDDSASRGGDLGFTPRGQLVAEYEDAAFNLPADGVSDLVRTQFGYHIIKVTEKKKEGLATLSEVQQQLAEFLKTQKEQAEAAKLVDQLRSQAKIEAFIPLGSSQPAGGATASSPRP